jgi:methanethiol S-methyltransferase
MILDHIILATLWLVYCVLHSVLASPPFKKWIRQKIKDYKWYRLWYTLFAFVFLSALVYYQVSMPTIRLLLINDFILIAGFIFSFSGIILMVICIGKYFMSISGLRSLVTENFSNELQITGIHRFVRHPLYLGTFAFIWGLFLLIPNLSLLIADIIITAYTIIGIRLEEAKLIAEFGEDYRQYQKRVPSLIPSLKSKREV